MSEKGYYILQILREAKEPIPGKKIKEQLAEKGMKMDIKTVYSAIEKVNEFCLLAMGREAIRAIHRKGFIIESTLFEDGQLQYLLDSIIYNPNLTKEEVEELQMKLYWVSCRSQWERLSIATPKYPEKNFSLLLNLTTVLNAITKQQPIYFQYVSYKIQNGRLIEVPSSNGNMHIHNEDFYLISPYDLVLRGSNYYVLGYFDKRKDQLSMYRVDRMRMIRQHKSKFIEIREQFDMPKELENNVNMFISETKIDIHFRFKDTILREVVNQFGTDFVVSKDVENWNVATVKEVALSQGLIGWIMMLQDQIQILEPVSLKETIIEKLIETYKLYNV